MTKKKPSKKEQKKALHPKVRKRQFVPIEPDKDKSDQGKVLTNLNQMNRDLRLVNRAVKNWNVKPSQMKLVRERMVGIVLKTTGEMMTKEGLVDSETKADELSVKAATVLVNMNNSDIKNNENQLPTTTTVNIQNNNVNTLDPQSTSLLELAQQWGAKSLVINGNEVSVERGSSQKSNIDSE